MKNKLKKFDLIRTNYRRVRKIVLHIRYGRFYQAFKLANHYNPVYRLIARNLLYLRYRRKQVLKKALQHFLENSPRNNGKFNIGLVLRDGDILPTSSAFIRLILPLTHASVSSQINLQLLNGKRPKAVEGTEIYIVQRTAFNNLKAAKKFISKVRKQGGKIIADNDDAFHQISEDHPEYYPQRKRVAAVEYLFDEADQIWLSTQQLMLEKFRQKSKVVTNSLDQRIWQPQKTKRIKNPESKIKMLYMGTATHDADFEMLLPYMDNLHAKYPGKFSLTTIGVSDALPQRAWIKKLVVPKYMSLYPLFVKWYSRQGPFDIGLSPLVDTQFNRSKSDIKCLDYLAAGIFPLVSDILPYQSEDLTDFIIKVDDNSWAKQIEKIVVDPQNFRAKKSKIIPKAQKYIWRYRSSEIIAKQLLKQFELLNNQK